jgi:tetratricopeptide (TPR) repeat protein
MELLGRFIEGTLSEQERTSVVRHLARCAKCRFVVERAIEIDDAECAATVPDRRSIPWWIPIAAGVLVAVMLFPFLRRHAAPRRPDPTSRLVASMPATERTLEPRLTGGFRWAPMYHVRRSSTTPKSSSELLAAGAAGALLHDIADDNSFEGRHAASRAYLVAGEPRMAIEILDALSRQHPNDASVWSDLAAALYCDGDAHDDSEELQRALAASDRAIRIEPRLPEAVFNRAVIVEATRTPAEARNAWNSYLLLDAATGWSREARERLSKISP